MATAATLQGSAADITSNAAPQKQVVETATKLFLIMPYCSLELHGQCLQEYVKYATGQKYHCTCPCHDEKRSSA